MDDVGNSINISDERERAKRNTGYKLGFVKKNVRKLAYAFFYREIQKKSINNSKAYTKWKY